MKLTVILPAKNEEAALPMVLARLRLTVPDAEVLVVDDGSTDRTAEIALAAGARVITAPYSMGNGAAIKRGARAANGDVFVFMDSDGQHDPADIPQLLDRLNDGYDMAVGSRNRAGQASAARGIANRLYNMLASLVTGRKIHDLTSGFRAVKACKFKEFLFLLPNGFSYPTTCTMAFFRSAYPVSFVPIKVSNRVGSNSHIKPFRDGLRFLLIIFKIATLYSPLKLFFPVSAAFFSLGVANYAYTYIVQNRLTNMSVLLLSASVIVFLIGLISEQITALTYKDTRKQE